MLYRTIGQSILPKTAFTIFLKLMILVIIIFGVLTGFGVAVGVTES
jgi:hypothetical protein